MSSYEALFLTTSEFMALSEKQEKELADRVKSDHHGITLDDHYDIEWGRINTAEKILVWVNHLSGKGWITTSMIGRIIDLASAHHKIDMPHGC